MDAAQRRLVLLRHAKSAWPAGVPDRRRPLADRGRRDVVAVGRWLRDHVGPVDVVVCSPAERARETWARASAELDDPPQARFDEGVYSGTPTAVLDVVRGLPDDAHIALVVGHNPDLEDCVALLTGRSPVMRTSAVAVLTWHGRWADAAPRRATLLHHATPRA